MLTRCDRRQRRDVIGQPVWPKFNFAGGCSYDGHPLHGLPCFATEFLPRP